MAGGEPDVDGELIQVAIACWGGGKRKWEWREDAVRSSPEKKETAATF